MLLTCCDGLGGVAQESARRTNEATAALGAVFNARIQGPTARELDMARRRQTAVPTTISRPPGEAGAGCAVSCGFIGLGLFRRRSMSDAEWSSEGPGRNGRMQPWRDNQEYKCRCRSGLKMLEAAMAQELAKTSCADF